MEDADARGRMWLRLGLIAAGLLVHAGALGGPFIFDDLLAIRDNPHVRTLWPLWVAAWADHESPLSGRPVPALSLALNFAAGGMAPLGYKAVNLGLHLLCGLALFEVVAGALRMPALSRRFGAVAFRLAFGVSLLWLVHPLTSECVHYVTQRTESWMSLAYLCALACTARAWNSEKPAVWRAFAVAACAFGMASKEVMASAPLAIAGFEWAYGGLPLRELVARRRRFYAALASCWLLLAALVAASFRSDTVGFDQGVSGTDYLLNQAWVIPRYLRLVVWPAGLSLDWGVPRELALAQVWPGLLATAVALFAAGATFLRRPTLGWPLVWVFALLAPTSSFLPIVTEVGAERRMYLPLAALASVIVVVAADWLRSRGIARVAPAILAVLALVLGTATASHVRVYRSRLVVWESAAAAFPDNSRAHTNVGQALVELARVDDAVVHMRRAVALDGTYAEGHNELGVALALQGDGPQARVHFERAIELEPSFAKPHVNLALLDLEAGRRTAARAELERALELDPASGKAAMQLAWLLATDSDPAARRDRRALRLAQRALVLGGVTAEALDVLAAAHASAGDFPRAVELATAARELAASRRDLALRAAIGRRLLGYQEGQPFRER